MCYEDQAAVLDNGLGDDAVSVGTASEPVLLSAGEVAGDGFSLCWWSQLLQPAATPEAVLVLETTDGDDFSLMLGSTELRARYQDGNGVDQDLLTAQHGLIHQDDWSVAHHW